MSKIVQVLKNIWILLAIICIEPLFTKLSQPPATTSHVQSSRFNCVEPDIEQFPKTFFNQNDRLNGAVIFYLLIGMYMFIALAIVCDEYFVPSLESICKVFGIKEDIAG